MQHNVLSILRAIPACAALLIIALPGTAEEGRTVFVGHNNEDMQVTNPNGAVTTFRVADVPPMSQAHGLPRMIAAEVVPVTVEDESDEIATPIPTQSPVVRPTEPNETEEPFNAEEAEMKLESGIGRLLTRTAVPRLPESRPRGRSLEEVLDAPETFTEAEDNMLQVLADDLQRQARVQVPINERRRGKINLASTPNQPELTDEERAVVAELRKEYLGRVVPQLPDTVVRRTARSSSDRVQSKFDPRDSILPIPEHLLSEPPAQVPSNHTQARSFRIQENHEQAKSFRIKAGDGFKPYRDSKHTKR